MYMYKCIQYVYVRVYAYVYVSLPPCGCGGGEWGVEGLGGWGAVSTRNGTIDIRIHIYVSTVNLYLKTVEDVYMHIMYLYLKTNLRVKKNV